MKYLASLILLSAGLALLLGGCGGGSSTASSPAGSAYFPLIAGSIYNYQETVTAGQKTGTGTFSVTVQVPITVQGNSVNPLESTGFTIASVGYTRDSLTNDYLVGTDGSISLFASRDNSTGAQQVLSTPEILLPASTAADTIWTWTNAAGVTLTYRVANEQTITISGTTYNKALLILETDTKGTSEYWYAQNIGLIKEVDTITATGNTYTTTLLSYTAGT